MEGGESRCCLFYVYLWNLHFELSLEELKGHMCKAGTVRFCNILTHNSGKSKGCAMVGYASEEECQIAIETLNKSTLRGNTVYVKLSEDRMQGPGLPGCHRAGELRP